MTTDFKDPILEAFLDEVVGGQTPPDLTAKIMQSLAEAGDGRNGHADSAVDQILDQSLDGQEAAAAPVQDAPQVVRRKTKKSRKDSPWLAIAVALSIFATGVSVGLLALKVQDDGPNDSELADEEDPENKEEALPDKPPKERGTIKNGSLVPRDENPTDFDSDPRFAAAKDIKTPEYKPSLLPERPDPIPRAEVLALVNDQLKSKWNEHGLQDVAMASDEEWCDRTYKRIIGRFPNEDERLRFVASKSQSKKELLVDELLDSQEFAQNWSARLATALVGRNGGTGKSYLASREGLETYLRTSLIQDKPYDQMAFELISATGSSRAGASDFNGATNFMLAAMDDKALLATAHTSRAFLGKRLECARCHDHLSDEQLAQKQYWELNSFLRQMDFEREEGTGNVRLVNVDFVGEADDIKDALVSYETPDGEMRMVGPVFDGHALDADGSVEAVDRRTALANRIIASADFSRATVNRVWSQMLVHGFTPQVDDMGSHNAPSHPELLDGLSEQFMAHDYDLKSLIRWVALSDAFGVAGGIPNDADYVDQPEIGDVPLFARFYERPVPVDDVQSLLAAAAKIHTSGDIAARNGWFGQFASVKEDKLNPEIIAHTDPTGADVISKAHRELLSRLAFNEKLAFEEKIDHVFAAAVSRKPSANEMRQVAKLKQAYEIEVMEGEETVKTVGPRDAQTVFEVVWLVLLNSNEFVSE